MLQMRISSSAAVCGCKGYWSVDISVDDEREAVFRIGCPIEILQAAGSAFAVLHFRDPIFQYIFDFGSEKRSIWNQPARSLVASCIPCSRSHQVLL